MSEKMTHSIALSQAIALLSSDSTDRSEIIEHLEALRASLDKRAQRSKDTDRKPTPKELKAQAERQELMTATFNEMNKRPDFLYECKMLADTMYVSTPKMAHILADLVEQGKVKRIDGKKPNFQIVKGE